MPQFSPHHHCTWSLSSLLGQLGLVVAIAYSMVFRHGLSIKSPLWSAMVPRARSPNYDFEYFLILGDFPWPHQFTRCILCRCNLRLRIRETTSGSFSTRRDSGGFEGTEMAKTTATCVAQMVVSFNVNSPSTKSALNSVFRALRRGRDVLFHLKPF